MDGSTGGTGAWDGFGTYLWLGLAWLGWNGYGFWKGKDRLVG
jgi:hypothetical protein